MELTDTSPEAEAVLIEGLRRFPVWKRLELAAQISRACREFALAGIRRRHPDSSERENRLRLAAQWIDRRTMIDAFGFDPEREGY